MEELISPQRESLVKEKNDVEAELELYNTENLYWQYERKYKKLCKITDRIADFDAALESRTGMTSDLISKVLTTLPGNDILSSLNDYIVNSNYGMWGKWYDDKNGFHRGIDMCKGGKIYSI